jgi:class 3 adenylate cyclase
VVDVVKQTCGCGFRLKVGIDTGAAMDSIHAATGRMAYRGKVMNRAARVAAAASTGQVRLPAECTRNLPVLRQRQRI